MRRHAVTGNSGLSGWVVDLDDHDAYHEHVEKHWTFLSRVWRWFRPPSVELRIAYSRPDGGVSIVTPTPWMVALLKRGGVIRHMRQVDSLGPSGIPVFEGTGELLPPMTEREAVEYIAWRDVPREVNHRVFLTADEIPRDRSRRNDWRLSEGGKIEIPA